MAEKEPIRLLLISSAAETSVLQRWLMNLSAQDGVLWSQCRYPTESTDSGWEKRLGRYKHHDVVVFDCRELDEKILATLADAVVGPGRISEPVVLLTRSGADCMCELHRILGGHAELFAPTGLFRFLKKMRQHPRKRFLRALRILSDIGPVVVELPSIFDNVLREPFLISAWSPAHKVA